MLEVLKVIALLCQVNVAAAKSGGSNGLDTVNSHETQVECQATLTECVTRQKGKLDDRLATCVVRKVHK